MDFIDPILEEDRKAPRKQRHTAHRIYVRLCRERPDWPVSESSVRKYVRERKLTLGLVARETFVPQHYDWGGEAQVDWYEADAELEGERITLRPTCMARNKHFWRLTNTHFSILVGSSNSSAMTISAQR
jgi:hypothetical protein